MADTGKRHHTIAQHEKKRQRFISDRINQLTQEIEDLNTQIADKNEAIASLIKARIKSIDTVRKSYSE